MSKLLVNIQLATQKGGKELEDFAKVAGMSADDFAKSFGDDPMTAIISFVEGLGEIDKNGGSVISTLDEMGITEIRMRDALLRLAGGSDLLSDAVNTSTTAWEENTALTTEAEKRYGTTASQLQLLKNEVTDMAIDLGTALIPVLLDFVNMAKPVIGTVKDMITSFSESSDGTKKFVGALLGFTIVGGPILKVFAGMAQGVGLFSSVLGKGMKGLVDYKLGIAATKKVTGLFTTATAAASGTAGLGGMSTAATVATGSMAPLVLGIAGVTAVLALGYGAWKIWGEKAYDAAQRTKEWGSDVGEEADKALTSFKDLSDEASVATELMSFNIEEGTNKAIESYSQMSNDIKEDLNSTIKETEENLSGMPEKVRNIIAESMNESVAEQKNLIGEIDTIQAEITKVYQNALAENRELTDGELAIVENYHARLAEIRSESLNLSAEEQKKVHAVLSKDLKEFSVQQLSDRTEMLNEETKLIKEGYAEQASDLEELLTRGTLSKSEYNSAMAELNQAELNDMRDMGVEYMKIWEAKGDVPIEWQKKLLADMGLGYDEIKARMDAGNQKIAESNEFMANSSKDASEEVRNANNLWNGMVLDEKTGEVKTNLDEFIQESSQSEEGWANMQFIAHNAELGTNAKEKIQEALMANGQWWKMDFPTQFADVETNSGETAQYFLQANYDWQSLSYEDKMAILKSNTPETLEQVLRDTGVWENLSPTEKEMIVTTNAGATAKAALIAHGMWDALSPAEKKMVVTSNSTQKALEGVQAAGKWNDKSWNPKDIRVESNAATVAGDAQRSINGVVGKKVYITTIKETRESYRSIQGGPGPFGSAQKRQAAGTNHSQGGPTILGDGGNNEPFLTPDGSFGISPNKDTLYDMPRGTKVWRNIEALLSDLPHYANGTMNAPIKVGDKTFSQLTDALVPFSAPSVMGGGGNARGTSLKTQKDGDVYNISITANGDLPKLTIRKMAEQIQQEIKNKSDRTKMSRGEAVTY